MKRKIPVSQDKLKQECLYQCLQQYEEKENKHVIIPSYVEIQKNIPCRVVNALGFYIIVIVKFSHNEYFLSDMNLLVSKHQLNHFLKKECLEKQTKGSETSWRDCFNEDHRCFMKLSQEKSMDFENMIWQRIEIFKWRAAKQSFISA